ncbi:MAG: hypothetical protein JXQ90_06565, partial [Cyclobacteriaceae bacterium]
MQLRLFNLILCALLNAVSLQAQNLFIAASNNNIISFQEDGTIVDTLFNSQSPDGIHPSGYTEFDGDIWGTTHSGGTHDDGVIYKFDLSSKIFEKQYDFDGENGAHPYGKLIRYNGSFWGVTRSGGNFDKGVLYVLSSAGDYEVVHHFENTIPTGSFVIHDGEIWMTTDSREEDLNFLIKIKADSSVEYVHEFDHLIVGSAPLGGLLSVGDYIYGNTRSKGAVLYRFHPKENRLEVLHNWDYQQFALVQYDMKFLNNYIWGITTYGGVNDKGAIFRLDTGTLNLEVTHYFSEEDGNGEVTSLSIEGDSLWGVATGGINDSGVLFSIDTATGDYTKLMDFDSGDHLVPTADWVFYADSLFGVTYIGGNSGMGRIYRIDSEFIESTDVFDFENEIGRSITQEAIFESELYFTTKYGGKSGGNGTLLKYSFDDKEVHLLHTFNHLEGGPTGKLLKYGNSLWGLSFTGGAHNNGAIFKYGLNDSSLKLVCSFDSSFGHYPRAGLTGFGSKLYGVTSSDGVLYEFDTVSGSSRILHEFENMGPFTRPVIQDSILYGLTITGGEGYGGVLYSFDLKSENFNILADLRRDYGIKYPQGGELILLRDRLFGTTNFSESSDGGSVFYYDIPGDTLIVIKHLESESDGQRISNSLSLIDGKIYGTTRFGGAYDRGVLFSLKDNGTRFSKLFDVPSDHILSNFALIGYGTASHQDILVENEFGDLNYGDDGIQLNASATSGLPVDYLSISSQFSIVEDSLEIVGAGQGQIVIVQNGNLQYYPTYDTIDLLVDKATLNVLVKDETKVYGTDNPAFTYHYEGFLFDDDSLDLDNQPTIETDAELASSVGSYPITLTSGEDNNYDFSYVSGALDVTKAFLTVTATGLTKTYGSENPALTYSYEGFVMDDDSLDLDNPPVITTEAEVGSDLGTYSIMLSSGEDDNYAFSYVSGELDVTKAVLTVTASDLTKIYGSENPTLTYSYDGFV